MLNINKTGIKLIEAVSQAVGKVYEPTHVKRMADAKAYEIRVISNELRMNSDLPIKYVGNQTNIDLTDFNSLRERAGYRLAYQEIRRQENIESVVDKALIEVDDRELQSDEPVNEDWINRFITSVGDISDEDMQMIWAKVLAGEVIAPRSFSLRTLNCLKNLTKDDARLFEKVCNYIIEDSYLFNSADVLKRIGIEYVDVLNLDECGLINSGGTINLNGIVNKQAKIVIDFDEYVLLSRTREEEERTIQFAGFPLTDAGYELKRIVNKAETCKEYIWDIVKTMRLKQPGCIWTLHKVAGREGQEIEYDAEETDLSTSINEHVS